MSGYVVRLELQLSHMAFPHFLQWCCLKIIPLERTSNWGKNNLPVATRLFSDHTLLSSSKRKVVDTSGNCRSRPKQESRIVKDQRERWVAERSEWKIREKDQSERWVAGRRRTERSRWKCYWPLSSWNSFPNKWWWHLLQRKLIVSTRVHKTRKWLCSYETSSSYFNFFNQTFLVLLL